MAKMSKKALGKRRAAPDGGSKSKKQKSSKSTETFTTGKPKRKPDQPKKVKRMDQGVIPVPATTFDSDADSDVLEDLGDEDDVDIANGARSFLNGIDTNAMSRSVKETKRLHKLAKSREQMPTLPRKKLSLPVLSDGSMSDYDIDSEDDLSLDDEMAASASGSGSSPYDSGAELDEESDDDVNGEYDEEALSDLESEEDEEEEDEFPQRRKKEKQRDGEAEYELSGRARWAPEPEADEHEVERLPIKLPSGKVQAVAGSTKIPLPKTKLPTPPPSEMSEDEEEMDESDVEGLAEKMAGQKGRFGRMNIAEIVTRGGWKNADRLNAAKEQIATIGAEILAGGELVDLTTSLTRLASFALPTVKAEEQRVPVPASIRGVAFLSQLAVYKDLIPGYRIRALTEKEEAEKVREEVKRQREGEKMLVRSYGGYLKNLEKEIKQHTALSSLSLRCMCELLSSAPHFNFSENIMGVVVGRVGKKSWDEGSDLVLQTFLQVFKEDLTGKYSQTLVRLVARMIKERKYQVHPNILGCFLKLRLNDELGSMREKKSEAKKEDTRKFKSDKRKKWATKNEKKREREMKEIRKEMAEAEAEVDKEERDQTHTETLKNLFVLYFSILKHEGKSPLLAAALEGIAHFAHHINIDFFRDLLAVLRKIIVAEDEEMEDGEDRVRIRLLAIVTAFELLSGQGEALNIDLGDFINQLFALLRPLALDTGIEDPPYSSTLTVKANNKPLIPGRAPPKVDLATLSTSGLLFRCLHATFFSRHASSPAYRTAAFAKRLVEASLQFPAPTAIQALQFVRGLMNKEPKLAAMLDTEERMFDGVYKPEVDDPQLCNPFATSLWELDALATRHEDKGVREVATKLRTGSVV